MTLDMAGSTEAKKVIRSSGISIFHGGLIYSFDSCKRHNLWWHQFSFSTRQQARSFFFSEFYSHNKSGIFKRWKSGAHTPCWAVKYAGQYQESAGRPNQFLQVCSNVSWTFLMEMSRHYSQSPCSVLQKVGRYLQKHCTWSLSGKIISLDFSKEIWSVYNGE